MITASANKTAGRMTSLAGRSVHHRHARSGAAAFSPQNAVHCRLRPPRPVTRCSNGSGNSGSYGAQDAMDDVCEPNPFDEDTAKVLLRVLTARAVKRLILQLQELDLVTAQWMNNYAAENSPMTGNEFIENLFEVKGTVIQDQHQHLSHTIDPQNLAHRILTIRSDMATKATMCLPEFTSRMDAEVMRNHLVKNTYMSGTTGEGDTVANSSKRRGYHRPPPPKR